MPPLRNKPYLDCIAALRRNAQARGSKTWFTYNAAYKAISNYPTDIKSPAEAHKIKGIGPAIVHALQKWFTPSNNQQISIAKPYTPVKGSGACALLIALDNTPTALSKTAITTLAQPYCNGKPWSGMRTLTSKNLVDYNEDTATYSLTDTGKPLAHRLAIQHAAIDEEVESVPPSFPPITPIIFHPGTFDIVLIVDMREIKGVNDRDYISKQLHELGVAVEICDLKLGDVLWVARRHNDGMELVLDYIIERKRMDDLVASIKDGRFAEQKARILNFGAARVVYIIKDFASPNLQTITTAISTTQVVDRFFVKHTKSLDHTICYLAELHKAHKAFETQTLQGIPDEHIDYATFLVLRKHLATPYLVTYQSYSMLNSRSGNTTLCDVFASMLATVRGVSGTKALMIAARYCTPQGLIAAYDVLDSDAERQLMIYNAMNKGVGTAVSMQICKIWYSNKY
ncbi:restriction endonuclease type II-like protein [Jimgerdemannia flammicorona]|uniref:Crossover junction endonuclease MUS81 n=1 Tax=Jimgerdemannia flammicorona TaxID=994334 RepID=A0A433DIQ6_9FUNG|nr:restriction endonuclease type II-like protein [Jimgerdemannia flammicorona]